MQCCCGSRYSRCATGTSRNCSVQWDAYASDCCSFVLDRSGNESTVGVTIAARGPSVRFGYACDRISCRLIEKSIIVSCFHWPVFYWILSLLNIKLISCLISLGLILHDINTSDAMLLRFQIQSMRYRYIKKLFSPVGRLRQRLLFIRARPFRRRFHCRHHCVVVGA